MSYEKVDTGPPKKHIKPLVFRVFSKKGVQSDRAEFSGLLTVLRARYFVVMDYYAIVFENTEENVKAYKKVYGEFDMPPFDMYLDLGQGSEYLNHLIFMSNVPAIAVSALSKEILLDSFKINNISWNETNRVYNLVFQKFNGVNSPY